MNGAGKAQHDARAVGTDPDGATVHEVTLRTPGGMTAHVLTYGAVLRSLVVPLADGTPQNVVLGFEDFAPYPDHSPYFGAVVGRYANRISGGGFPLDGAFFPLPSNAGPGVTLHGGPRGFSTRNWTILALDASSVTLGLHSPDGDEGFPGAADIRCRYMLVGNRLQIGFLATSDRPTVMNLSQHSYFNLDGSPDVTDHILQVFADSLTEVDGDLVPTGRIVDVTGTAYDLRQALPVGDPARPAWLDHNYILNGPLTALKLAARLTSPRSGLRLEVRTTKPGLQVYDGNQTAVAVPGLEGRHYGAKSGLCLEPQLFPDSPNQPGFPLAVLRPGEHYTARSEFTFSHVENDGDA